MFEPTIRLKMAGPKGLEPPTLCSEERGLNLNGLVQRYRFGFLAAARGTAECGANMSVLDGLEPWRWLRMPDRNISSVSSAFASGVKRNMLRNTSITRDGSLVLKPFVRHPYETVPGRRLRLIHRDGRCVRCGREPAFYDGVHVYCADGVRFTVDHVHPLSLGGTNDPENLQCLCAVCNGHKGSTAQKEMQCFDAMHGFIWWGPKPMERDGGSA